MSDQPADTSDAQSGNTRKKVLFGILALLLVALLYDYAVARPSVETAYNQIVDRSTEVNSKSTEVFTNLDVRELLGKEPSRTFDDANGDKVEVYSWRSGLPIKSHELFTVYKPNNGKFLFYRHAKFQYETSGDVSEFSVSRIVESDPSETYDDSMAMQGQGGGGPGGGGPGGGGPGGVAQVRVAQVRVARVRVAQVRVARGVVVLEAEEVLILKRCSPNGTPMAMVSGATKRFPKSHDATWRKPIPMATAQFRKPN